MTTLPDVPDPRSGKNFKEVFMKMPRNRLIQKVRRLKTAAEDPDIQALYKEARFGNESLEQGLALAS